MTTASWSRPAPTPGSRRTTSRAARRLFEAAGCRLGPAGDSRWRRSPRRCVRGPATGSPRRAQPLAARSPARRGAGAPATRWSSTSTRRGACCPATSAEHRARGLGARRCSALGPRSVVVTLGARGRAGRPTARTARGCRPYVRCPARRSGPWTPPAPATPSPARSAWRLGRGDGLEQAVRYAVRVGAAAVTRAGAQESFPSAAEVEASGAAGSAGASVETPEHPERPERTRRQQNEEGRNTQPPPLRSAGRLGHGDGVMVCDAGLPIPAGPRGRRSRLPGGGALLRRGPGRAAGRAGGGGRDRGHGGARGQPGGGRAAHRSLPGPWQLVPHEELKAMTREAKLVVRTGEARPYANVLLRCGVPF